MRKEITILILGFFLFIFFVSPISFWWPWEKRIVKSYYDNLIQEKYQDNYRLLYLYKESFYDAWEHSNPEANELYLKKIEELKKTNYRFLGYDLKFLTEDYVKYAQLTVTVEINGQKKTFTEDVRIKNGNKIWVGCSDDPMKKFRDGQLIKTK
ncbi:MAG: hypothetical protein CVV03_02580 [Firmicutes bacterium HGW-Firmicutes-8]|nr:MAG: hypothetical protein CVV03_02580 [Firmicutes bacterium HGW-Firmicutes-8]